MDQLFSLKPFARALVTRRGIRRMRRTNLQVLLLLGGFCATGCGLFSRTSTITVSGPKDEDGLSTGALNPCPSDKMSSRAVQIKTGAGNARVEYDDGKINSIHYPRQHRFSIPFIYSTNSAYDGDRDPLPWFYTLSSEGERIMLVRALNKQVLDTDRQFMKTFERNVDRAGKAGRVQPGSIDQDPELLRIRAQSFDVVAAGKIVQGHLNQAQRLLTSIEKSSVEGRVEAITELQDFLTKDLGKALSEYVGLWQGLYGSLTSYERRNPEMCQFRQIADQKLSQLKETYTLFNDAISWLGTLATGAKAIKGDIAPTVSTVKSDLDKISENSADAADKAEEIRRGLEIPTAFGSIGQVNPRVTFFNMRPAAVVAAERGPSSFSVGERRILDSLDLTQVATAAGAVLAPPVIALGVVDSVAKRIIKKNNDYEITYLSIPSPLHNGYGTDKDGSSAGSGPNAPVGNRAALTVSNNGKYELLFNPTKADIEKDAPIDYANIDRYNSVASSNIIMFEAYARAVEAMYRTGGLDRKGLEEANDCIAEEEAKVQTAMTAAKETNDQVTKIAQEATILTAQLKANRDQLTKDKEVWEAAKKEKQTALDKLTSTLANANSSANERKAAQDDYDQKSDLFAASDVKVKSREKTIGDEQSALEGMAPKLQEAEANHAKAIEKVTTAMKEAKSRIDQCMSKLNGSAVTPSPAPPNALSPVAPGTNPPAH